MKPQWLEFGWGAIILWVISVVETRSRGYIHSSEALPKFADMLGSSRLMSSAAFEPANGRINLAPIPSAGAPGSASTAISVVSRLSTAFSLRPRLAPSYDVMSRQPLATIFISRNSYTSPEHEQFVLIDGIARREPERRKSKHLRSVNRPDFIQKSFRATPTLVLPAQKRTCQCADPVRKKFQYKVIYVHDIHDPQLAILKKDPNTHM